MTKEEALRKGIVAATLLENEDVMAFFHELKEDIRTTVFATAPEDEDQRKTLYYDHRAVEALMDRLKTYKAAAEQIVQQAEEANKEIDY